MKVFVARHAETNYNLLGLCNDDPVVDVHLTENGKAQAAILAEKLKDEPLKVVIISELPRTRQTADIVNKHHNAPIVVDARINDIRTGFEGKPAEQFRAARSAAKDRWTASFNGGESFEDTKQRVAAFLHNLKSRSEQSILIVTHQPIYRHIYGNINQLSNGEIIALPANNAYCFDFEL